jgi:hypothetical protein
MNPNDDITWDVTKVSLTGIAEAVRWIKARYGDIKISEVEKKLARGD